MKHRAFTLVEALITVAILAIIAAVLFPVIARGLEPPRRGTGRGCTSNLKQIGLGFLQYASDYNNKLPPTSNATGGWTALLQPYFKSERMLLCSSVRDTSGIKATDYFANARLSGLDAAKLTFSQSTILAGDGLPNQGSTYSLWQLPPSWRTDRNSPAWRHFDAANYLYADGHVKQVKPAQITLDAPGKDTFTFRAK